jgi:hypothetical protein
MTSREVAVPWLPPGELLAWLPAQAFHHFDFAEPKRIDDNFAFIKSGLPCRAFGSQFPSKVIFRLSDQHDRLRRSQGLQDHAFSGNAWRRQDPRSTKSRTIGAAVPARRRRDTKEAVARNS